MIVSVFAYAYVYMSVCDVYVCVWMCACAITLPFAAVLATTGIVLVVPVVRRYRLSSQSRKSPSL